MDNNKILLIEDNDIQAIIATVGLENAGYEVTVVSTHIEADALYEDGNKFDIVISDNNTDEVKGGEQNAGITWIPKFKRTHPNTPVILLTAGTSGERVRKDTNKCGADLGIEKCHASVELVDAVKRLVSQYSEVDDSNLKTNAAGYGGAVCQSPLKGHSF